MSSTARRPGRRWPLLLALLAVSSANVSAAAEEATAETGRIRPPALAGTWYPDGRLRLLSSAHYLMRTVAGAPRLEGRPVALVVPHAAWPFSGLAAATAYRQLRPGDFNRVVIVAPTHHGALVGYALDDAVAYRTPLGDVPLCTDIEEYLAGEHVSRVGEEVAGPEHAVEVQLPFLQVSLGDFCLVPILVGDTDAGVERTFAERLVRLHDGRTLFVFSTDLAHYGPRYTFEPFGPVSPAAREKTRALDEKAVTLLERKDADGFRAYLRETGNTICGRYGLGTLLELLPRIAPEARATLLAHYASADLPGFGDVNSVTYVALGYSLPPGREANGFPAAPGRPLLAPPPVELVRPDAPPISDEIGRRLLHLARATFEARLDGRDDLGDLIAQWPEGFDQERHQGVFVSLYRTAPVEIHTQGLLRACRGQALPTFPLYFGTVQAALDAVTDQRFEPVTAGELEKLQVEVTVLSRHREIGSPDEIRLGTHGIVLEKEGKAALFLPQVPEQNGWSLDQTLSALSEKAGLPPDAWKAGARLFVFTGQVFAE